MKVWWSAIEGGRKERAVVGRGGREETMVVGRGGREETVVGRPWRGRRWWSDVRERERGEREVNGVRGRKMWCGGCKKVCTCVKF